MLKKCLLVLLLLFTAGCAPKYFKVDPADYQKQVRTLGVLPLMVDDRTDYTLPRGEALVEVLRRSNRAQDAWLIDALKARKDYFDVRRVNDDPAQLFSRIVRGSTLRGSGDGLYRSYVFDQMAVGDLARENAVDGLLVVIFNGIIRNEKHWDRDRSTMEYLEASYNSVQATAAVVLTSGEVVWEYPGKPGDNFLLLQYPDFDEAYYNRSSKVNLKYVTVEGAERALGEHQGGFFVRSGQFRPYKALFDGMVKAIEPDMVTKLKNLSK